MLVILPASVIPINCLINYDGGMLCQHNLSGFKFDRFI